MTSVVAIRHVVNEGLGSLEDLFRARDWSFTYFEAPLDDWSGFDPLAPDLLVVLGGPIGANDAPFFPFLAAEQAAIERRIASGKPIIGICLGSQLIARSLGAKVYPAHEKEIGWGPLLVTKSGYASPVKHLAAEETFVFHWHGDTFDLPKGAVLHAGTPRTAHQIFTVGKSILAMQCHPEVRARDLETWFVAGAGEFATTRGVNVPTLRGDTQRYCATLEKQAKLCFEEWFKSAGL